MNTGHRSRTCGRGPRCGPTSGEHCHHERSEGSGGPWRARCFALLSM